MNREVDYLVVHCAYTPPSMDIGVAEIDTWHRNRGFNGIGYHRVIRRSGAIEKGRSLYTVGAHAKGYNSRSIGSCWVGGKAEGADQPEMNFTEAQFLALRGQLETWKRKWPDAQVVGHRDLPGVAKACPCFDVSPWWNESVDIEDYQTPGHQEGFWRGIDYFRPGEFAGVVMDEDYVQRLDDARTAMGDPFHIVEVKGPRHVIASIQG